VRFKRSIIFILSVAICINAIGLIALRSTSPVIAKGIYMQKQILAVILSWLSCVVFAFIPLSLLFKYRRWLLLLAFIALILVLIPGIGKMVNGSRRWIQIPGFSIQLSEFAKIPFVIWLAGYIYVHHEQREILIQGFLKPLFICGSLAFFVFCEPDYGGAFLLMIVALSVLFLMGVRVRHTISLFVIGGFTFFGLVALNPNRLRRITAFFDAEERRFDATYQLWQGMLCFASGGLWGNGIGLGRQKLSYLPEAHTDFIFPVIGEELGGIFSIAVVCAFLSLAIVSLVAIYQKMNNFIRPLGFGSILLVAFQAIINIGVVTGCLPTKGMPLPFISYGGSNLVAVYSLLGLVINCLRSESLEKICKDHKKIIPMEWLT
jgi:cell division protein FtsW